MTAVVIWLCMNKTKLNLIGSNRIKSSRISENVGQCLKDRRMVPHKGRHLVALLVTLAASSQLPPAQDFHKA